MVNKVLSQLAAGEDSAEMQSESRQITVRGCWTEYTILIEVLGVEKEVVPIKAQNTTLHKPQNEGCSAKDDV